MPHSKLHFSWRKAWTFEGRMQTTLHRLHFQLTFSVWLRRPSHRLSLVLITALQAVYWRCNLSAFFRHVLRVKRGASDSDTRHLSECLSKIQKTYYSHGHCFSNSKLCLQLLKTLIVQSEKQRFAFFSPPTAVFTSMAFGLPWGKLFFKHLTN